MKPLWLPILLLCSGCAAMNADPWGWLDDPAEQKWIDVTVAGYGREISYSIPDRLNPRGQRPRIWPPLEVGGSTQNIRVSDDLLQERSTTLAQYIWDRWWGGFMKGRGHDHSLNVFVVTVEEGTNLLELGIEERMQMSIDYRTRLYDKPSWESQKLGEYFFQHFEIFPFESRTGHTWVVQNDPNVTEDHVYYTIPITDRHILEFSFFVRDKRYDWKDDPEWNARRWALVEQIMNTVRITPDPFPEEGEAAVSESRFN